ncbi:MAG: amidohydrolase family protein [Armatimonadota bacterium]
MRDLTWIDAHVHVSNMDPDGTLRDDILAPLLEVLDRSGEDLRMVVSADFPWPGMMQTDPEAILEAHRFIHDLCRRAPERLYGAFMPNPHFMDESLAVMERCFEQWDFVMVGEMLQYIFDFYMDSAEAEQLVRRSVEYDVPVQVHISTSNSGSQGQFEDGGTGQIADCMALAERVPEADYILAHFIGTPADDPPVVSGYLDQIEAHFGEFPRNFWAEIRDFESPGLQVAMDRIPHDRLIVGTDYVTRTGPPFPDYGVTFRVDPEETAHEPGIPAMVDYLKQAGADDDDIRAIGYRNLAGLLGI